MKPSPQPSKSNFALSDRDKKLVFAEFRRLHRDMKLPHTVLEVHPRPAKNPIETNSGRAWRRARAG